MADERTQRQGMLDGDLYIADDPELAVDSLRARRLRNRFNATPADVAEARPQIRRQPAACRPTWSSHLEHRRG